MYAASSALAFVVLLATFQSEKWHDLESTQAIPHALGIIVTGLCINCYQCVSANSADCKDPFNKSGRNVMNVNCDGSEVSSFYSTSLSYLGIPPPQTVNARRYCVKMVLESSAGDSVIRTCVEGPADNINKTCVELERGGRVAGQVASALGFKNTYKYCNVCDSDNCNGAGATAASLALAAGAAALAYFGNH